MNKCVLVGLIVFFTSNLIAQNKKIIGDWKEDSRIRIDTLYRGFDIINSDPVAYKKGYMSLSYEYLNLSLIYADSVKEKFEISIIKVNDDFWVNSLDFKAKLIYEPKKNNYYIKTELSWINGVFAVEYDVKHQKLLFIDEKRGVTFFEFSRK